jgi:hypothetical protein
MMVASTDRPDMTDTSQATADELRALWNPMAANAGVYEVAGNLVTIRPIVAKIPPSCSCRLLILMSAWPRLFARQTARSFGRSSANEEAVIRARFEIYMALAVRKIETPGALETDESVHFALGAARIGNLEWAPPTCRI